MCHTADFRADVPGILPQIGQILKPLAKTGTAKKLLILMDSKKSKYGVSSILVYMQAFFTRSQHKKSCGAANKLLKLLAACGSRTMSKWYRYLRILGKSVTTSLHRRPIQTLVVRKSDAWAGAGSDTSPVPLSKDSSRSERTLFFP